MMPSAVVDANVVIGLSKGGCFHLLPTLFARVYVTEGVRREIILLGRGRAGSEELQQALSQDWAVAAETSADRALMVDYEVIEAAKRYSVDYVLTGDVEVAAMAESYGFKHLSAPDIVAALKLNGAIPSAHSVLQRMASNGFGIEPAHLQTILDLVGES